MFVQPRLWTSQSFFIKAGTEFVREVQAIIANFVNILHKNYYFFHSESATVEEFNDNVYTKPNTYILFYETKSRI